MAQQTSSLPSNEQLRPCRLVDAMADLTIRRGWIRHHPSAENDQTPILACQSTLICCSLQLTLHTC
jgi:hypothetical protein